MKSKDVRFRGESQLAVGTTRTRSTRAGQSVLVLGRGNDGCSGSGCSIPAGEEARMVVELLIQGGLVHDEFRVGDGDRRRSCGVFGMQRN